MSGCSNIGLPKWSTWSGVQKGAVQIDWLSWSTYLSLWSEWGHKKGHMRESEPDILTSSRKKRINFFEEEGNQYPRGHTWTPSFVSSRRKWISSSRRKRTNASRGEGGLQGKQRGTMSSIMSISWERSNVLPYVTSLGKWWHSNKWFLKDRWEWSRGRVLKVWNITLRLSSHLAHGWPKPRYNVTLDIKDKVW